MGAPRAEILCVGTELLRGKPNTHVPYLSKRLSDAGFDVARSQTVADSEAEIRDAVAAASARSAVVVACGGLGPTFDDLTREGTAAALGRRLSYRPALYRAILRKYRRLGVRISSNNKRQAWVLEGARVLLNREGSAPGQLLVLPGGRTLVLLPGPFSEMSPMFEEQVLPRLRRGPQVRRRVWRFCGIAESAADRRLGPLVRRPGPGVEFTILASPGAVELHCAARTDAMLDRIERRVRRTLGPFLYGRGGDTLESKLGKALRRRGWTLAVAESCTGGLFSERITSVPGSSDYFLGGALAYADSTKRAFSDVSAGTLARHGAVSPACAREMARGVRARLGSDLGVSITGIAGPSGGSRAKPVGLVFLGLSTRQGTFSRRFLFRGDRAQVRSRAASAALHWALKLTAAFIKR